MNNTKKVFLHTMQQRKPYHIQHLKARYKEQITLVDSLEDAELVLCIGVKDKNSWELLKAREMGIKITYFNDELLPERIIENELSMENKRYVVQDEIAFTGEEL